MIRALALALLLASPAQAGEINIDRLPAKLGCPVVRALYRHYAAQGFNQTQMAGYLRSRGISEAKIEALSKCLK